MINRNCLDAVNLIFANTELLCVCVCVCVCV